MSTTPKDAIDQLTADHTKVKKMFDQFESIKGSGSDEEKQSLVNNIVDELKVHEAVENDVRIRFGKDVVGNFQSIVIGRRELGLVGGTETFGSGTGLKDEVLGEDPNGFGGQARFDEALLPRG